MKALLFALTLLGFGQPFTSQSTIEKNVPYLNTHNSESFNDTEFCADTEVGIELIIGNMKKHGECKGFGICGKVKITIKFLNVPDEGEGSGVIVIDDRRQTARLYLHEGTSNVESTFAINEDVTFDYPYEDGKYDRITINKGEYRFHENKELYKFGGKEFMTRGYISLPVVTR